MPLISAHKKRNNRSLMAEKKEEPVSQSKSLTDSDSSDNNKVNPRFKTVERGPSCQKAKINKPSAQKMKTKASDAQHKDK